MKKLLFTFLLCSLFSTAAMAQKSMSISVRGGLPLTEFNEVYSFSVDADISYHSYVFENLMLGGGAGYGHIFGETLREGSFEFEVDDYNYVPVFASAKFYAANQLYLGVQPGYAIALGEDTDGGFMIRFQAGYNITESLDVVASYQNILVDLAFPSVNLGVSFYP